MEQLAALSNRKVPKTTRLTVRAKIIKEIIKAIQDKKGEHIVTLDLRKVNEAVSDFFIICEANNTTQIKAIADNIEDRVREQCSEKPYHHEGLQALQWVIIDYVNVVVHVMMPETRKFYNLEELWSDGVKDYIEE